MNTNTTATKLSSLRTRSVSGLLLGGLAAAAVLIGVDARAAIINTSNDIVLVGPPPSVQLDDYESDTEIRAFDERACFLTTFDIEFDDGTVLQENRWVSTHLLHADPETTAQLRGRVRFDGQVLGIISTSAGLDATDATLGHPGVLYPITGMESFRGIEAAQNEGCQIGGFDWVRARFDIPSYSDQCRVVVDCG